MATARPGKGGAMSRDRNGPDQMTETVPALPGFAPERVAADPSTEQVLSVNSPTDQLVRALLPVGAYRTDDHRYYWNTEGPVPSVTTVLGILNKPAVVTSKAKEAARAMYRRNLSTVVMPEEDAILWALAEADKPRDAAASLGSSIHILADIVGTSESDPKGFEVSEREKPYVDAFRHFLSRYGAESIVSSEKMVWSLNGYAGTYDLLMMIDSELWLLDIKTSKGVYPEYGLQLAAYSHADYIILPGDPRGYPMPQIQRTGILHLRPDTYTNTGWRLIEYPTTDRDYIAFLGALEVYNWNKEGRFLKSKLSTVK